MTVQCIEKNNSAWPIDPFTRSPVTRRCYHRVKKIYCDAAVQVSHAFVYDVLGRDSDPERDAERTFIRAREKLKWRCIALRADHLLTLTYRQNVADLEESRKHLRLFWKLVKRNIDGFRFVGVAERQERGAVHWHLGLHGFHDVALLRRIWSGVIAVDGYDGNIDIQFFHGKSSERIGSYISKYLFKGFEASLEGERPRYSHYYVTSRGLVFETLTFHAFGYSDGEIAGFCESLLTSEGARVRTRWRMRGGELVQSGGLRSW